MGIVVCLLEEVVVALPLMPRAWPHVDWRRIGLLLVAALVGAPLGNYVLTLVAPQPMRWAISRAYSQPWRCWRAAGAITVRRAPRRR